MIFQCTLILILLTQLRKSLQIEGVLPEWNKFILGGIVSCAILIAISSILPGHKQLLLWTGYVLLFAVISAIYYIDVFKSAKALVNAFFPLIAVALFESILKVTNPDFEKAWSNYFDAATLFAAIWMVAMLIMNNRQKKALEKERLKREAQERDIKQNEILKAALEVQVLERTAEITSQKEELQLALNELKATQAQLIQSEKMASLGELTAGIAHEIQNPLNFVNNFSEVNSELITEMKQEIESGNFEVVKALAKDIEDNEQKIVFHGKRADAIVKGMLQHSRSSNGIKEPADINALADEYLRLSYHGLRAKDKSFNAIMKTDFDTTLGKVNVLPQDLGRVILNLLTNAFYAVNEKSIAAKASGVTSYKPTVTISTRRLGSSLGAGGLGDSGRLEIRLSDNGSGIPHKALDKIFQPFFTTKPTGQGTGLGLSMSYDIITKGHGGELKVETKEHEGTTFIIILPL